MSKRTEIEKRINHWGMTLVELMVSLVIFGVIIAVVFGFLHGTRSSYTDTRERVHYQQSVRAVISMMAREIRSAGCDAAGIGFEKISVADLNQIRIQSDLNGDGDVADTGPDEDVTYTFDPATGDFSRNDGVATQVILRDLVDVNFSFFDDTGTELTLLPLNATDRELVHYVEVDMDGESKGEEPVHYTTRILVRNF